MEIMLLISVTILTKNSERRLHEVLQALSSFESVLIYDTGSNDRTLEIARSFSNVVIHEAPFEGFGVTHNKASSLAQHDWILSIDSDEVMTPELREEIHSLELDPNCVYAISRKNFFNGRWIRGCGWSPDRQVKLYNRKTTRYSQAEVHEAVMTEGLRVVNLVHPVLHYPYEGIRDFLNKMQLYSDLWAKQNAGRRQSSVTKAVLHAFTAFWKSYLLKGGFRDGREGLIISAYNGHTAFYKYLKLTERNRLL